MSANLADAVLSMLGGIVLPAGAIVALFLPNRVWRWFVSRRVVCSWCKCIVRIGGPLSFLPRRRVSHGCCARCAVKSFGATWLADRSAKTLEIAAVFFFLCAIGFSGCKRHAAPKAVPAPTVEQSDEPHWQLVAFCEVEA